LCGRRKQQRQASHYGELEMSPHQKLSSRERFSRIVSFLFYYFVISFALLASFIISLLLADLGYIKVAITTFSLTFIVTTWETVLSMSILEPLFDEPQTDLTLLDLIRKMIIFIKKNN
jgi:uncharacterized membrane protein (DUF485 family)